MPKLRSQTKPLITLTFIGIDPGKNGGLVALFPDGKVVAEPMPSTERGICNWFKEHIIEKHPDSTVAVIEKVHSRPQQSSQSGFTFGKGYGFLLGMLAFSDCSSSEDSPQTWQKALGITPRRKGNRKTVKNKKGKMVVKEVGGESHTQFKNRLLSIAQKLYPQLPLWREPRSKGRQLAVADALLIATYCKRKFK
jgi:hypothetical protein